MAVRVELVQVAASTAGGTQDITIPGLGASSQLRAAVFWWSRGATSNLNGAHAQLGVGWTTGAASNCAGNAVAQNVIAPSQGASLAYQDACVILGNGTGGLLAAARFSTWITDGVRIEWLQTPNQGILLTCLLIADDDRDVQVAAGTGVTAGALAGEVVVDTRMPDEPELVLAFSTGGAFGVVADGNAARTDNARLGLGWCSNARTGNADLVQHGLAWGSDDNQDPTATWWYTLDGATLGTSDGQAIRSRYVLEDFGLDGVGTFRVRTAAGSEATPFGWLAISFNRTVAAWSGVTTIPEAQGAATEGGAGTDLDFPLQALLALQSHREGGPGFGQGTAVAIGGMTASGASSAGLYDTDAVSPSAAMSVSANGSESFLLNVNGTLAARARPAATRFPAGGGYALTWDRVTGTPLEWPVLALGTWVDSPDRGLCRGDSRITATLRRKRRLTSTLASSSGMDQTGSEQSPWPPAPPEPPAVTEPTPAQVQYIVERLPGQGTDTIRDGAENVLATDNRGIVWLAENGYLQSGDGSDVIVGIRGIVGQTTQHGINGGQSGTRIDNVVHFVAMDPGQYEFDDRGDGIKVLGLGWSEGGFEAIHFWRLTWYNVADSLQCIITQDNESTPSPGPYHEPTGFIGLHYCKFTGFDSAAYSWGAPAPDGLPAKWWINGKGAASWWIRGCLFPDVREHSHYLHYPQVAWIEENQYRYTGGTCGQFVSRAGRLEGYGFLHGNPYWPPAGSLGPLVIRNNVHDDGTEIPSQSYRDGGSFTVVGWLGDLWFLDNVIKGNVAAGLVIWADTFKGMYLLPTEHEPLGIYRGRANNPTWDNQDTTPSDPPVHRATHGRVYVHNWDQQLAEHNNREQFAVSGANSVELGRVTISTVRPGIMLNTEFGGPWRNKHQVFRDEFAAETWQATDKIGTWEGAQGPSGSNIFWDESVLQTMLASRDMALLEGGSSVYGTLTKAGLAIAGTSAIIAVLGKGFGARLTSQSSITATMQAVAPPSSFEAQLSGISGVRVLGMSRTRSGLAGIRPVSQIEAQLLRILAPLEARATTAATSSVLAALARRRAAQARLEPRSVVLDVPIRRRRGLATLVAGGSTLVGVTRPTADLAATSSISLRLGRRLYLSTLLTSSSAVAAGLGASVPASASLAGLAVLVIGLARRRSARSTVVGAATVSATLGARQLTSTAGVSAITATLVRARRLAALLEGQSSAVITSSSYEAPLVETRTFRVRRRVADQEPSPMPLHQDDVGVVFEGAILDETGQPIPIPQGAAVELRLSDPDGITVTKQGSVASDAGPGIVRYTTQPGDLPKWGTWKVQWGVTYPGGQQFSTPVVDLVVEDNLEED